MLDGRVVETLGEFRRGMGSKIKIHVTDDPDWPLKLRIVGPSTVSAPISAGGLVPFVEALLDAAQYEGPELGRFSRRLVGRINSSTRFRRITHRVYRTGNPTRPVRVVHRRSNHWWVYRLTENEAIWMADLISERFAGERREPPGRYR